MAYYSTNTEYTKARVDEDYGSGKKEGRIGLGGTVHGAIVSLKGMKVG